MLVSLWKVEDEATATLMATFYRKWIGEGKSKAQSLREAKLEMAAGPFSHPRQWAAFVLIGIEYRVRRASGCARKGNKRARR